ncbi:MAG: hypothetical protein KGI78_01750 [Patescibacteria group bacterium]|nr:hypothetical protein [Patescibacteria group bacterium]MDE1944640.1 hypothetical protein [Patescibacteria group bacterium]MDE1945537.1 hypothetical protein [Patescibacteria group bacterium]MDE2057559.1 hypothetical protein [Patescibacteria group bacterium]
MTDARLDAHVHGPKKRPYAHERLESYDTSDWYLAEASLKDIGVWRRAGGLPREWTNRSLQETAEHVRTALRSGSRKLSKRARSVIPQMLETNVWSLQKHPYLLPIGFAGRTGTWPRKYLRYRTAVELDDGNMRAIALAVAGTKTIRVYYGIPRKKGAVR